MRLRRLAATWPLAVALSASLCAAADSEPPATDDWRAAESCVGHGLTLLPEPAAGTMSGCEVAWCVTIDAATRICHCLTRSGVAMVLARDGQSINAWESNYSVSTGIQVFSVLVGDLDGDGVSELIVADNSANSNGISVAYWSLWILDGRDWRAEPLRFTAEDFGPDESFRARRDGPGCDILATEWTNGTDPKRGEGTYLVGSWFRYAAGHLLPVTTRPVLRRRLLNSFVRELDVPGSPFRWLTDPRAETAPDDTLDLGRAVRVQEGTVESSRRSRLLVRLEGGQLQAMAPVPFDANGPRLPRIVDAASGRTFPPDYFPADIDTWVGSALELRRYGSGVDEATVLVH